MQACATSMAAFGLATERAACACLSKSARFKAVSASASHSSVNSACATPSSIYPILIKLSNAHLGKIEGGLQIYYSKKIQELLSKIAMPNHGTPLPNRLTLEEQGAFILGYYQETQARFTSKEEQ